MRFPHLLAVLSVFPFALSAEDSKPDQPCTIRSATTGTYFNLRPISLLAPKEISDEAAELHSWHALGYDYGVNFTINFCAPVLEKLTDVAGVDKNLWQNVSAYYTKDNHTYSIG
jgi:cation-dependent mannose-6-phosphate receptor